MTNRMDAKLSHDSVPCALTERAAKCQVSVWAWDQVGDQVETPVTEIIEWGVWDAVWASLYYGEIIR